MIVLSPFFIALLVTLVATPLVAKLAVRLGAVDQPGGRRVHRTVTPRLGGIAIYAGLVAGFFLLYQGVFRYAGIILGMTILLVVGYRDDVYGMKARNKLFWQTIAALALVVYGYYVNWLELPFAGRFYIDGLGIAFTLFWTVGMINTFNLTDGLDGLAAGTASIAAFFLLIIALNQGRIEVVNLNLILLGACLGFLYYNFNPAKIFMGDTGSMILGYFLAAVTLEQIASTLSAARLLVPLLVVLLPVLDVFFAIVRRKLNQQPIFSPDRGHIHHRLLDLGFSAKQAVAILYTISCSLGMLAISVSGISPYFALLTLALGVIVISRVASRSYLLPAWLKRKL